MVGTGHVVRQRDGLRELIVGGGALAGGRQHLAQVVLRAGHAQVPRAEHFAVDRLRRLQVLARFVEARGLAQQVAVVVLAEGHDVAARTEVLPRGAQPFEVQRLGAGEVVARLVRARQVERGTRPRLGLRIGLPQGQQRGLQVRGRLVRAAQLVERVAQQHVGLRQRLGRRRGQRLQGGQRLFALLQRGVELAAAQRGVGPRQQGLCALRAAVAAQFGRQRQGLVVQRGGLVQQVEVAAQAAEQYQQLEPQRVVRAMLGEQQLRALLEQFLAGHLVRRPRTRAGARAVVEQAEQEALRGLRTLGGLPGLVRLPHHQRAAGQRGRQRQRRQAHRQPVPPGEATEHVAQAVGPREDWPVLHMTFNVLGHGGHRGIAFGRQLAQGLLHDHVEVATQLPRQCARCNAGQGGLRVAQRQPARPHRVGMQDGLFQRGRGIARRPVHAPAEQQLEQHRAQGVDVGGRAHRAAGDLLRRGIEPGRRCTRAAGARQLGAGLACVGGLHSGAASGAPAPIPRVTGADGSRLGYSGSRGRG